MKLSYGKRMAMADLLLDFCIVVLRVAHRLDPSLVSYHHVSGISIECPRREEE